MTYGIVVAREMRVCVSQTGFEGLMLLQYSVLLYMILQRTVLSR